MCVLSSLLGMESGRVECLVRLSMKPESYPSWQMHRFHDRHLRNTNKPRAESVSPQPAKGFEDFQVWAGPWGWRCLSWVTRARWRWLCPSPPPCTHAGRCVHGAAFCLSFLLSCHLSFPLCFPGILSPPLWICDLFVTVFLLECYTVFPTLTPFFKSHGPASSLPCHLETSPTPNFLG